jgi:hypothetical protein
LIADVYPVHEDTLRRPRGPTREHHVEPAGHPDSASARRPDDRLARDTGHGVPEDVVRRRFIAGRENFETLYKPLVDEWLHYDNSGTEPELRDRGKKS